MKTLTSFIIYMLICGTYALKAQELGDFRWQYRILLLMDPNDDPRCEQQLKQFIKVRKAMQERDLLLFVFDGKKLLDEQGNPSGISVREIPHPSHSGILLIGKDGGVKLRKPFPVTPESIFERIDAMPMRRGEIPDRR